jgi:hypothetical protein
MCLLAHEQDTFISCDACGDWYHLRCVQLICTSSSHRHAVLWCIRQEQMVVPALLVLCAKGGCACGVGCCGVGCCGRLLLPGVRA